MSQRSTPGRRVGIAMLLGVLASSLASCSDAAGTELEGRWRPTVLGDSTGGTISDEAHISFTSDGKWAAADACNDTEGEFTVDDDGGNFESVGEPVAGVVCEEGTIEWPLVLSEVDNVTFDEDGAATLKSASGTAVVVLVPDQD